MSQSRVIKGLREIFNNYDTFILDQWGVMHDGYSGFDLAIKCIDQLRLNDKNLIIVSNSSKKKEITKKNLNKLGFHKNDFVKIMTSGEMIWNSLRNNNFLTKNNIGMDCFHIHNKENNEEKNFLIGLEKFNFVEKIDNASFILGCTPFKKYNLTDYIPILLKAKKNNLPFICANPDFEYFDSKSNSLVFCMGTIAELYKNIGGNVLVLGKPSIEIYEESVSNILNLDKNKILAIGDSLDHDIVGASNFGIDNLFITSTGIHKDSFNFDNIMCEDNKKIFKNLGFKPTFISSDLRF